MTAYVCIQMYSGYDQITVLLGTSDNILSDWSSQKFIGLEFAFDYYIKATGKKDRKIEGNSSIEDFFNIFFNKASCDSRKESLL